MRWGASCYFFCSRHALNPSLLVSHFTRVLLLMLKCYCLTIFCIACFMFLNAAVCCSLQSNFFLDVLDDSSGLIGADNDAWFGMSFIRWWMHPINDLSCFNVLGFSSWMIASVFPLVGLIPSEFILYPSQMISLRPNSHLCKFIRGFSQSVYLVFYRFLPRVFLSYLLL